MKHKIEKGIPVPATKNLPDFGFVDTIKPSESVLITMEEGQDVQTVRQALMRRVYKHTSKNPSFKVATRKEDNGFRVWRIN